jgi:hypothetical protein
VFHFTGNINLKGRWHSDIEIPYYSLHPIHENICVLRNANSTQIVDSFLQKPEAKQECYQGINTEFEWVGDGVQMKMGKLY